MDNSSMPWCIQIHGIISSLQANKLLYINVLVVLQQICNSHAICTGIHDPNSIKTRVNIQFCQQRNLLLKTFKLRTFELVKKIRHINFFQKGKIERTYLLLESHKTRKH